MDWVILDSDILKPNPNQLIRIGLRNFLKLNKNIRFPFNYLILFFNN